MNKLMCVAILCPKQAKNTAISENYIKINFSNKKPKTIQRKKNTN